jgi:tetratricopeptide (TPR) repeat protein
VKRVPALHPATRMDLLLRTWELQLAFDFPGIRALLEPVGTERLFQEPELVLSLVTAYSNHGQTRRSRQLIERARHLFGAGAPDTLRLRFLNVWANALLLEGHVEQVQGIVREYQALSEAAGDDVHRLWSCVQGFMLAGNAFDWVEALRWLQQGLHLARTVLHGRGHLALWHHNMAMTCRHLGLFAEAQRHHEEGVRAGRPEWVAAHSYIERGLLMNAVGDHDVARALALRAVDLFRRVDSHVGIAEACSALGAIALSTGDLAEARSALVQAREALDEPNLRIAGELEEELAVLELLSGNARARRAAQARATRIYNRMGAPRRVVILRLRLAALQAGTRPDPVVLAEQATALLAKSAPATPPAPARAPPATEPDA